jgi:hypothetical protein
VSARWRELVEEFRTVVAGRGNLADAVIAPLLFVILNALLGLNWAIGGALLVSVLLTGFRLIRGEPLKYALGGLGAATVAILAAKLLNSAAAFFLPGAITGVLTAVACGLSVVVGRPLVAWTSHLARRWPLGWYWHPKVRPAYTEVTMAWAVFFALRVAVQLFLLQGEQGGAWAVIQVIMGWPATIVLLVVSYLYGLWRLQRLQGPSVDEYKAGADPPWAGQRRGF